MTAAVQSYLQRKATGSSPVSYGPAGNQVKGEVRPAPPSAISFVPSTVTGENLVVVGRDIPRTKTNLMLSRTLFTMRAQPIYTVPYRRKVWTCDS